MRAALILCLGLSATSAIAHIEHQDHPREWRLRNVAETYRAGDTAAALEMLRADPLETRRQTARATAASHRLSVAGPIRPGDSSPKWTLALLRAAGAVHMEDALEEYKQGGGDLARSVLTRIEIAEILLDEVAEFDKNASDAAGWEWAIGQQAMSDGAFHIARPVLLRACDRYPKELPLLILGCGSLHESAASFNIDTATALRRIRVINQSTALDRAAYMLMGFRSERNNNLNLAAKAFVAVRALDPRNVEAALRLGHVRLRQEDPEGAAETLEPLVRLKGDQRVMYLSRLFLGRARERQNRPEDASALFREAVAVLPAQSARLSLAQWLHARGRNDEARLLADAVTSERDVDDPWWSYRFGQYWLLDATLAALRAEARR